jgi:hypothetical protein
VPATYQPGMNGQPMSFTAKPASDQTSQLVSRGGRWYDSESGKEIRAGYLVPDLDLLQNPVRAVNASSDLAKSTDSTGQSLFQKDGGDWRWNSSPPEKSGALQQPGGGEYESHAYIQTANGGYIDTNHFKGAVDQTNNIIDQLQRGETTVRVFQEARAGIGYEATYTINKPLNPDQILGVALGIFQDYSTKTEEWQGGTDLLTGSSFAMEDLPTDYLGFYSAATKTPLSQIVEALGGGTPTDSAPLHARVEAGLVFGDPETKNHEFTPRIQTPHGYENVPWPSSLQLEATPSNSGLWTFSTGGTAAHWW